MNLPRCLVVIAALVLLAPLGAAEAQGASAQGPHGSRASPAAPEAVGPRGRVGHGGPRGMHRGRAHRAGLGDERATPEQRLERRLQNIVQRLGLDEAQTSEVRRVLTEGRAQHEALRAQPLAAEEARSRHQQIFEATGERVRALLRPEQQPAFDGYAARVQQRRMGAGGPRARARFRERLEALGLDEAQRIQARRILEEAREQHRALGREALAAEERRSRRRALAQATAARIRGLLRGDQRPRFDEQQAELQRRFEALERAAPRGGI